MTFRCAGLGLTALSIAAACSQLPQYEPLPDVGAPVVTTGGDGGGRASTGGAGGAGATGGMSGAGGAAGSVGSVDADRPVDAEQPAGGCGAPSRSCAGDVLSVCEPSGNIVTTMCANGCDPVKLECFRCKPNSRTCTGASQVICNAEGTESTTKACTSGCNAATGECNDCQPSTVWCNGDVLRECTATGAQRDKETCPQGCNPTRMTCNTCRPAAKVCNGNTLETCKLDGTGTTTETCPAGCNTTRAACNTCEPGTKMCSGSTLRTCKTDGSGYSEETCATGCNSARGACNTCNPAQGPTCDGNSLKTCMPDGSAFATMTCARGCASGACCGGNTEASGGSCAACGTDGQPCCRVAQPGCGGNLTCQGNGRCAVPCGNGAGQRCCEGDTKPCTNNCGRQGNQTCSGGSYGACSVPRFECCPPMERCSNGAHQVCNNNGQWVSDGGRPSVGCCNDDHCNGGKTCQGSACRCPSNTLERGGSCEPCGSKGQRCCAGDVCRGQFVECFVGNPAQPNERFCSDCGTEAIFCCNKSTPCRDSNLQCDRPPGQGGACFNPN
jgi:hypothetical protein